ncbi:MAG: hypothetical protein A2Y10_12940 [Planctomycetes bacterium GWF2_41_51]|nr:MAG: hypothetical protein A2Y10_12940 [Planctomycetes bacterium GWF2_41_51]
MLAVKPENNFSNSPDQIATLLRNKIVAGEFKRGDKLPTTRQLTKDVKVSNITITKALNSLKNEGLIRVGPRGTFVEFGTDVSERTKISNSSREIAVCLSSISIYHYARIFEGVESSNADTKKNRGLQIYNTNGQLAKQADTIMRILDKKSSGLILVPCVSETTPPYQIRILQSASIPVVFCLRGVEGIKAPLVGWDWEQVGKIVATEFLNLGHRKIAYIAGLKYSMSETYERAMNEVLKSANCPEMSVYYGHNVDNYEDGAMHDKAKEEMFNKLLSNPQRPTAIFCNDGTSESLIYLTAQKYGLKIPQDLSVICFEHTRRDCVIAKKFTTIGADHFSIGEMSLSIVDEMIEGKRSIDDDEKVLLPITLSDNKTLTKAPA